MKTVLLFLVLISFAFAQLPEYHLARGWNMVGGGVTSFPASAIDSISTIVPPIYRYDPITGVYESVDSLLPLYGYWVLSTDSLIIGFDGDSCDCPLTVTDIDGNVYETVLIGDQCWMAENLKTTHYRDGTPISNVTSATVWETLSSGAYCNYSNDSSYIGIYGRLYNWYAVDDSNGLAPEGWHVPTDEEWKQLEMYLGMSAVDVGNIGSRGTSEGSKLGGRADLWEDGIFDRNSEFGATGFSGLPGGYRDGEGFFFSISCRAFFWSSSEDSSTIAFYRLLYSTSTGVYRNNLYERYGFSVRCVMD